MKPGWRYKFLGVIFIAGLGVLWEIVSRFEIITASVLFPPPSQVVQSLVDLISSGVLIVDIKTSLIRVIIGLVGAVVLGVAIGMATGRNNLIDHLLTPVINLLRPLPAVAIVPLVIVWFGIGDGAKIFTIAFAAFFPVWLNTHTGVERVAKVHLWSAQLLTHSKIKILASIIFPSALPFTIVGIRQGIALAYIMVFVSELTGASNGLGYRISFTQITYRIDSMMAALFVLAGLAAITDLIFIKGTVKIWPWLKHI